MDLGVGRTLREIPPAHYTLKVDSFSFLVQLLEKTGEKSYESEVFEASCHKWKLCLYPTGDEEKGGKGHISLYLAITNTQALPLGWEVNASFKFFVFDQYRGKYLTIQDVNEKPRRYHAMKTLWGFPELLPFSVFNDPTEGYLVGDKCVFGVEVFVIKYSGAGELLPQPTNRTSSCFTWIIHNYSLPTGAVRTQSFVLEACNWTLELHPKGFLGDRPNHFALAFFLDVTKNTPKVYADFKLTIKNQADGKDITLPGSQWFFPNKRWITRVPHKLSPVSDVSKGFLVNDLLVVNFEITRIFAVEKFA
ncbi:uncharacterized protein LOC107856690 isoform X1 [Capsicum annuum]|uniref:uncharacterized protein LOC107856690 isoform X1 n=1 Tax=Capsicum annuum TaxID=4072 RepID=UPI001FB110B0|nr:uncharacterized protein LOC107856690 isoform X1 [Capsicum annuum]XP_047251322.1 uncharacterized protein LOC107856690 isoform X1 [Capsicum annuum]XP_047251332.1 uncharacterized protein LOC107856690 isoform X1 [Capsicum annuum]